jgi:adenine-specific DNA glycosylase
VTRRGNGIFDFLNQGINNNKDIISKAVNTAKDIVTVGKNTKDIINSIRKKQPIIDKNVTDIVKRIRALKSGQGFAYV